MNIVSSLPRACFHQVLTSTERNVDLGDWSVDFRTLGLPPSAPFSVTKRRLHGGKQEGVDLIELHNGKLALTVVPTRGMGILRVEGGDVRLEWGSPVRQVVHPSFVQLMSRGGLGWLDGFNEWLVRCGLESAGAPGRDQFITNTGAKAEMDLTLHGKIANLPASDVELSIDAEPPHRLRLCGRVDERMFYGPKLELWTEISFEPNASSFRIEDKVVNRGGASQEFELIYHVNFGAPLLEAGAQFVAAVDRLAPMNDHAATGTAEFASYPGPTRGFVEQVYCLRLRGGLDGRTTVLLRNAAGDRGCSMGFGLSELPCFSLWKSCNQVEEGYVTGLEPGTNFPFHRRVERAAGRVQALEPGAEQSFRIDCAIHSSADEVRQTADSIAEMQGGPPPKISTAPVDPGEL